MSVTWETTRRRHGTQSGWALHMQLSERPCDACYRAKHEYDKHRRGAGEQTRRNRLLAKAQARAQGELARRHPEEYREAYERYKRELLGEDPS